MLSQLRVGWETFGYATNTSGPKMAVKDGLIEKLIT